MQLTKTSLRQWWLQYDIKTTTSISISQFYHTHHVGFSKWPKTESWYRVCLSLYMRISQNSRMVCLSVSHSNWSALFEICSNCNKLIYISTKVWATRLAVSLSLSLCAIVNKSPVTRVFVVHIGFLSSTFCLFVLRFLQGVVGRWSSEILMRRPTTVAYSCIEERKGVQRPFLV
jgi:hypothetical protein